jgi:hypothetical protein
MVWRLNNHIGTAVLLPSLHRSSKSWGVAKAHAAVSHLEVLLSLPGQSMWYYGGQSGAATGLSGNFGFRLPLSLHHLPATDAIESYQLTALLNNTPKNVPTNPGT